MAALDLTIPVMANTSNEGARESMNSCRITIQRPTISARIRKVAVSSHITDFEQRDRAPMSVC
jgi:hypothetical protein